MRWIGAAEAWQAGLVSEPAAEPAASAMAAAAAICELDRAAVARLKQAVNDRGLLDRLAQERQANAAVWTGSMSRPPGGTGAPAGRHGGAGPDDDDQPGRD